MRLQPLIIPVYGYLFRKSFHPLVRRVLYPYYWIRDYRGIPMVKLDEGRIRWIIKCKEEGKKNAELPSILIRKNVP